MLKKKIIDVQVPLLGKTVEIFAAPEQLRGKTLRLDLTRELRGKNLEAVFQLVVNGEIVAKPKEIVLLQSYIRRLMRRGTSYVEDSFVYSSKDVKLRMKIFLITRKKVHRAIRAALRNKAREFLIGFCKEKSYEELFSLVLNGTIQKELGSKLRVIYPLSVCEIRRLKLEKS